MREGAGGDAMIWIHVLAGFVVGVLVAVLVVLALYRAAENEQFRRFWRE
jgi:hypothetical protein